jgi:hypothetical protein
MFHVKKTSLVMLGLLLLVPALLLGQGYVQQVGATGNVDWTNQTIRCTGIGAPSPNLPMAAQRASALRAAKLDAWRNLLETIQGVYLTSSTTVENAMLVSDQITARVEGALKGFHTVDTRYMSTGDVEVDVEVAMTGVVFDALLGSNFGGGAITTGGQLLCPTCGQPWPTGRSVPAGVTLIQAGAGGQPARGGAFTGLVVDARGLGVRPAMAPKVLNEQGEEVYGSRFVSREYAVDIGMVGYEKDINRARSNERVTDNPLVVTGIQASGPNKTDIVISSADAMKIHSAAANMNFLQHCKVMFILD